MKISARNQFQGTVTKITEGQAMAEVMVKAGALLTDTGFARIINQETNPVPAMSRTPFGFKCFIHGCRNRIRLRSADCDAAAFGHSDERRRERCSQNLFFLPSPRYV